MQRIPVPLITWIAQPNFRAFPDPYHSLSHMGELVIILVPSLFISKLRTKLILSLCEEPSVCSKSGFKFKSINRSYLSIRWVRQIWTVWHYQHLIILPIMKISSCSKFRRIQVEGILYIRKFQFQFSYQQIYLNKSKAGQLTLKASSSRDSCGDDEMSLHLIWISCFHWLQTMAFRLLWTRFW